MGTTSRTLFLGAAQFFGPGEDGVFTVDLDQPDRPPRHLGLAGMGGVRALLVDHQRPDRLYALTGANGVLRSDDRGESWEAKHEGLTYKEGWSLAQHPVTGALYVGTGPATIFRSVDGAETWTELRQCRMLPTAKQWGFPGPPFLAHVKGIGLCPDDADRVIAAVEEGWLLRTVDGGSTWENLQQGTEYDSHNAYFVPDAPDVVISTSGTGVYRSTDGGDSFQPACEGLDRRYVTGLAFHPGDSRCLVLCAAELPPPFWRRPEGAGAAFYRSEDQGVTWHKVDAGGPEWLTAASRVIVADPLDPDTFFVGMTDGGLWASSDGAKSLQPVLGGLPPITAIAAA